MRDDFNIRDDSVHLRLFPDPLPEWRDPKLEAKWNRVREIRRLVTGALEVERAEKRIGSSLEASVCIYHSGSDEDHLGYSVDMAELAIASDLVWSSEEAPSEAFRLDEVPGFAISVTKARGGKCGRCWRYLDSVGSDADQPDLCERCLSVVRS